MEVGACSFFESTTKCRIGLPERISPYSRSKRVPGPKSEYRRQTDRMFAASVFLVVIFVHDVQRSR